MKKLISVLILCAFLGGKPAQAAQPVEKALFYSILAVAAVSTDAFAMAIVAVPYVAPLIGAGLAGLGIYLGSRNKHEDPYLGRMGGGGAPYGYNGREKISEGEARRRVAENARERLALQREATEKADWEIRKEAAEKKRAEDKAAADNAGENAAKEQIAEARRHVNQMNAQIKKGDPQTRGIQRIDFPLENSEHEKLPHVHFDDGTVLNCDGSPSHHGRGLAKPTKRQKEWLRDFGWIVFNRGELLLAYDRTQETREWMQDLTEEEMDDMEEANFERMQRDDDDDEKYTVAPPPLTEADQRYIDQNQFVGCSGVY